MDRSALRTQLRNLEQEAQSALARDASFFEALLALKWEVDNDARVRAAMRALRDRGLSVYSAFVPQVRVWLHAGETVLALHSDSTRANLREDQGQDRLDQFSSDSRTQELRDTASTVIAASRYRRQLKRIVNEAVQASDAFERLAAGVERSGYELQICLDLSTYAQVREKKLTAAADHASRTETYPPMPENAVETSRLPLSRLDVDFLKELRIRPD
jgi:hypothetical protein